MEYVKNFTVEHVPDKIIKLLDYRNANAMTKHLSLKGSLTGKSSVYFSKRAFISALQLYTTMGHEFVHVCNYITAASMGLTSADVQTDAYMEMTEYWAYSFQAEITKSTMNSFDMMLIYSSFANTFGYYNYKTMTWYNTRKKF